MCLSSILDTGQLGRSRGDVACRLGCQGPQQCTLLGCRAKERETRYPTRMGRRIGHTPDFTECKTQISYLHGEAGWRDIRCILGTTRNARNAETKHQSRAVPILLLANCFNN